MFNIYRSTSTGKIVLKFSQMTPFSKNSKYNYKMNASNKIIYHFSMILPFIQKMHYHRRKQDIPDSDPL